MSEEIVTNDGQGENPDLPEGFVKKPENQHIVKNCQNCGVYQPVLPGCWTCTNCGENHGACG